jgi:hypothetical protein
VTSLDIISCNLEYWHTADTPTFSEEYIVLVDSSHRVTIWHIDDRASTDIELGTRACESEYLKM